jgi:hypothetical protein
MESFKTTLVTCLFNCHEGTKFDAKNYYYKKSLRTMAIEQPMIIFCDKENEEYFRDIRKALKLDHLTKIVVMDLKEFYIYKLRDQIDKRYRHGGNDDDKTKNPNLYVVWLSKFEMVLKSIELNPFNSTHFTWIDINLITKTCNNSLNYIDDAVYNKIDKICKEPKDKLSIQILNYWHPEWYSNLSSFFSSYRWIVCGAFFTVESEIGKEILPKFTKKAEELLNKGFCQGDESIFAFVIDENEDSFNFSVGDYEDCINNYYKPETKIDYVKNILSNYAKYRPERYNKIVSCFK